MQATMSTGAYLLARGLRGPTTGKARTIATYAWMWCLANLAQGFRHFPCQGSRRHLFCISSTPTHRNFVTSDARRVLVPIGDGSEEIESVTIIDVLRRAGAQVTTASVMNGREVTCSRGVKIMADCQIRECASHLYDLIACPGGDAGARNLAQNHDLQELLRTQSSSDRLLGAICAAPAVVLAPMGLLEGKRATCFAAKKYQDAIPQLVDETVVIDGNIITSQGPGTAMEFSLKLVELLYDKTKADQISRALLVGHH